MADEKDIEQTPEEEPTVEETADAEAAVEETPVAEAEEAADAAVEESSDEELAEAAEEPVAEEETEPVAETEEKPKRRSRRKKADDEPEAEEDSDSKDADAEKPKRRRRGGESAAGVTRRAPRREPGGEPVIVRAKARYVHHAPRKARLVVDHIRGKDVAEARAILIHTPRAASRDVLKLLDSAIANAENNHELVADELKIHQAFVDEGPTLKRFRPRALGRATRIRKRTSHMTILLTTKE